MHQSVATISSPQFLNLQPLDVNPLMSKCEIKVLYVGANRNDSFITKQVAAEIGKTLRGAPIVGYYKEKKEDFADHGEKVIFDDEGIHFECETKPYGFVAPNAEVWFQDFEDSDGMGNSIIRTYLMTTGYLWTGQYPESSLPVEEGRPQSMELDRKTLDGSWQTNLENGMEYFIINDAIISKLCILGEDVQPCFEGASITAPNVSSQFTLDDNFKHTLFSMMQDLQNALKEGGQQMEELKNIEGQETEPTVETSEEFSENLDNVDENNTPNIEDNTEVSTEFSEENPQEEKTESTVVEEENKDNELIEKYSTLENDYNTLKESYDTLKADYDELVEFKRTVDNERKDALITQFYMLDNEDKKDVVENKEKYSLEEIKAKLSMICFDKKISFSKEEEKETITYSLDETDKDSNLPDWVKAVKEQEKLD